MIAGRYTLQREIGRGGMGAVWLGRDQVLGRLVALKRVGTGIGGNAPDLERAEREARLAARLNHPRVVAVFDLVTEGDERWLVMEYVASATLATMIRREGALPPDRAAPIIAQAADALAAAHAAGIVHRDVKPSNILVTPDGQVKLTDFGIARAQADAALTQTGMVTGSPAYLAPEVASGQQATAATDVWSLGATLFHALSGHPPYDVGDNVLGALYRIVHEEPPRLTNADWLTPLLAATMTPDPQDRWSSAEVRAFLAAGPRAPMPAPVPVQTAPEPTVDAGTRLLPPVPAVPAPVAARAAAPGRRRALPVLAVLAFVAAVVVVAWLALGSGSGDKPARAQPAGPSSRSGSSDETPHRAVTAVTTDGMESFVEDYLATVTTDPQAAWDRLTPSFQEQSGNFGQYQKFWRGIATADLVSAQADPDSLTISYTVEYQRSDGSKTSDDVTLQLEGSDGDFFIAGET